MKNLFSKLKDALFKTGSILSDKNDISDTTSIQTEEKILIEEDFYEDVLEKLIRADVGLELSEEITNKLKVKIQKKEITKEEFKNIFKLTVNDLISIKSGSGLSFNKPALFLVVGVNGSGKTTSIAKIANKFKNENLKVLIVAGDTFRAAAGDQLSIWAEKVSVDLYSPPEIKKPDAVVYGALEKAKKENYDVVIVDTAGRLHSQKNLMDELKKVEAVIEKNGNDFYKEKLIVLDSTIGQNAIVQAKEFGSIIKLTGIILSKLDSSSKGGVVLNIMYKLSLPVKLIGVGEKADDLLEFNFNEYLDGLLG